MAKMKKSDFKALDNAAYGIFRKYILPGMESCERSWANLQLYSETYHWQYAEINGRLWVASFEESYIFFPLGDLISPEELQSELQSFAACCSDDAVCGDVPWDYLESYPEAAGSLAFDDDPGDYDYIYDTEHLCSFSGSKLRKRHNQVRQFDRAYENVFAVKKIVPESLPEILVLAERLSREYWADSSGAEERLAFSKLSSLWSVPELQLDGIALYVQGTLVGFSIYSLLNKQLADIHFEKADRNYSGCGAKVTAVLAEYLKKQDCRFMNREQDLNEPGLRRAKEALDPDHLYRRLSIKIS